MLPANRPKPNTATSSTELASNIIAKAENIIILAGAGMSEELGVKTYWTGYNQKYAETLSDEGFSEFDHAHEIMWHENRELQIQHYNNNLFSLVKTNVLDSDSPYRIMIDYLNNSNKNYYVVTSNVDGAFVRSGFSAESIYEVHGSRLRSQCLEYPKQHGVFDTDIESGNPTNCPTCHGQTRPNCFFFADFDFNPEIASIQRESFIEYRESLNEGKSIIVEVGAGITIPTIRNQANRLHHYFGISLVRINKQIPKETQAHPVAPSNNLWELETTATSAFRVLFNS